MQLLCNNGGTDAGPSAGNVLKTFDYNEVTSAGPATGNLMKMQSAAFNSQLKLTSNFQGQLLTDKGIINNSKPLTHVF